MRIAILGSGSVGGYFGGRLAGAGAEVVFIARGAHLNALRSSGLRIESPFGDLNLPSVHATDDPVTVGQVNLVFFTVKLYDTDAALGMLPPLIGDDTVVVPFQNGIDTTPLLTRTVGLEHTAGGTAYVSAIVAGPGVIRHVANQRLVFGELDGRRSARMERLETACRDAGIQGVLSERIEIDVWTKFVWLSVLSAMTAVTRLPVGPILADPDLVAMCQAAGMETMAVARANGIPLTAKVFDEMLGSFEKLPPQSKSSMLDDLERGRRLELPWLSGAVVRHGDRLGVPTPTHRFVATVLGPYVEGRP